MYIMESRVFRIKSLDRIESFGTNASSSLHAAKLSIINYSYGIRRSKMSQNNRFFGPSNVYFLMAISLLTHVNNQVVE